MFILGLLAILFGLVNDYREDNNVPVYLYDPRLAASAQWKAEDFVDRNYFAHTDPDGRGIRQQFCEEAGYCYNTFVGENAAAGYSTPESVIAAWKTSYGHNWAMLTDQFIVMGLGHAEGGTFGHYYVLQFGNYDSCDLRPDGLRNIGDVLTFRGKLGGNQEEWDFDWDGDVDMGDVVMWGGCLRGP